MEINQTIIPATIVASHAASEAIPLMGAALLGIYSPAAWTATTAKLVFNVHPGNTSSVGDEVPLYDDTGWQPVINPSDGTLATVTLHSTPAAKFVPLSSLPLMLGRFIQIVTKTSDGTTDIVQAATRAFKVVVGPPV